MHTLVQCFRNALVYFAMAISYAREIFMKLTPGWVGAEVLVDLLERSSGKVTKLFSFVCPGNSY